MTYDLVTPLIVMPLRLERGRCDAMRCAWEAGAAPPKRVPGGGKAAGGSERASRSVPLRWDGRSRAAGYRMIGSQSEEKETEAKRDRGPGRGKSETDETKIKRKERKEGHN